MMMKLKKLRNKKRYFGRVSHNNRINQIILTKLIL